MFHTSFLGFLLLLCDLALRTVLTLTYNCYFTHCEFDEELEMYSQVKETQIKRQTYKIKHQKSLSQTKCIRIALAITSSALDIIDLLRWTLDLQPYFFSFKSTGTCLRMFFSNIPYVQLTFTVTFCATILKSSILFLPATCSCM